MHVKMRPSVLSRGCTGGNSDSFGVRGDLCDIDDLLDPENLAQNVAIPDVIGAVKLIIVFLGDGHGRWGDDRLGNWLRLRLRLGFRFRCEFRCGFRCGFRFRFRLGLRLGLGFLRRSINRAGILLKDTSIGGRVLRVTTPESINNPTNDVSETRKGCHRTEDIVSRKEARGVEVALRSLILALELENRTVINSSTQVGTLVNSLSQCLFVPTRDEISVVTKA